MRDREGFSLTTNKDVAWTKENGLWPEGPIDDKGVAVNISASKGIGGLVAAALRVAGGNRLSENGSTNSQNIQNDDAEEQIEMQRLCAKIKSAAEAKKNREDSANETLEQRAQAREKDLEDLQTDMETTRHMMEAYVSRCEKALEEMIEYAELQKEESAQSSRIGGGILDSENGDRYGCRSKRIKRTTGKSEGRVGETHSRGRKPT